jgi:hypothetical protein
MKTITMQSDGSLSDKEISDAVSHAMFTFRDDGDMSNRELLEGMLKSGDIDALQYFRACTRKSLMVKLGSVTKYMINRGKEVWEYHMGQRSRDQLLTLDGRRPISNTYLKMIEKYAPVWKNAQVL